MPTSRLLLSPLFGAVGSFLLGCVVSASAQRPFVPTAPAVAAAAESPSPAPASLSYVLARIALDQKDTHSVYSLRATEPIASSQVSQKVRLTVEDTTPQGTTTRQLSLSTGKHKTVAQLCTELRDIFRKYMGARRFGAGSEVGKIGDAKYGGEIRFVVESEDYLRYDLQTQGEENHSTKLSADDVSNLIALLGEAARPKAQ